MACSRDKTPFECTENMQLLCYCCAINGQVNIKLDVYFISDTEIGVKDVREYGTNMLCLKEQYKKRKFYPKAVQVTFMSNHSLY